MTAMALPNQPDFDWEPVRQLPYVRSMQLFAVSGFDVAGHPGTNADFPRASLPSGVPMGAGIVDAGRSPRRRPPTRSPSRRRSTDGPVSTSVTSSILEVPGPGVLQAMILGEPRPTYRACRSR